MEKFVVSDTNIFIDLINIDVLDIFFQLPWEIHTTDMIVSEFTDENQKKAILGHSELVIKRYEPEELSDLVDFHTKHSQVSINDCSVWQYAKQNNYVLLSGDGYLRKLTISDGIEVRGTIFVIEQLVDHGFLTAAEGADVLDKLKNSNTRQPLNEIQDRIRRMRAESNNMEGNNMQKKI